MMHFGIYCQQKSTFDPPCDTLFFSTAPIRRRSFTFFLFFLRWGRRVDACLRRDRFCRRHTRGPFPESISPCQNERMVLRKWALGSGPPPSAVAASSDSFPGSLPVPEDPALTRAAKDRRSRRLGSFSFYVGPSLAVSSPVLSSFGFGDIFRQSTLKRGGLGSRVMG